jgi:RNA polymerase sigma factor (TIGR02999 family)
MSDSANQVTKLLQAIDRGERGAVDDLLPLVYDELRSRAGKLLAGERRNHTLQRTALVHEAFLKLAGGEFSYQSRMHFFNAAALAMRRILVDHAIQRRTLKRGGERGRVNLSSIDLADDSAEPIDWLALDDALKKLQEVSPRQHQVVMLRFFSGRTEREIAEMMGVSESTVDRDWVMARAWLFRAMQQKK